MLQHAIVALVVAVAFGYSAWALMPATWRAALRRRLGLRAGPAAGGCGGCGDAGCGAPARSSSTATAVVQVHRRPPGAPR